MARFLSKVDEEYLFMAIFAKTPSVLGIRGVNVPLPSQPTFFTCTLNNGIHYVTTPESRLARDTRIEQEFEL